MRLLKAFACVAALMWLGVVPSHAEKRVALVIGNSGYQHAGRLGNPAADAAAFAALLKAARFDVVEQRTDVALVEMNRAIGEFADAASDVPPIVPAVPAGRCGDVATLASLSSRAAKPLSSGEECALKPKDVFKECEKCPEMIVVPSGSFTMGSPAGEEGRFDAEGPQHAVTIGKPFAMGKFHITVDQFAAFVTETGYDAGSKCYTFEDGKSEQRDGRSWRNPGFSQAGSHPAVCLNWNDARAYVEWLAKTTGKPYRLLTEAEWEYATRAGTTTRYFFGNDEKDLCRFGNGADQTTKSKITGADKWTIAPCSDGYAYTAPAGSFSPNAFGLYDVHGNAWQWLEDCWHDSYAGAPSDGSAWVSGDCSRRVVRGGSWFLIPRFLRAASRSWATPVSRYFNFGFRLGRTLAP